MGSAGVGKGGWGDYAISYGTGGLGGVGAYQLGRSVNAPAPFMIDAGPRPVMPEFQSLRDRETGLLANENYRLNWGPEIVADQRALQALRGQALAAPGTSEWERMARDRQALEQAGLRTGAEQRAATAASQARSSLASRGGLSSGAAERLQGQSLREALLAKQGVAAQGAQARADIGLQAEQMRRQDLGNLASQELAYLQPQFQNRQGTLAAQQFNVEKALQDKYAEDQAKQLAYQEQMKSWAAAQQANAISAAGQGKKGGGGGGGGGKK